MIQNIKKFFEFSHTEIRGFFILLIIMVLALLTPFLMNIFSVQKPLTFEQEKKSLDSLVTLLAKQKVIVEELQIKDTIFQKRQFQKKDTVYQAIFVKKTENIRNFVYLGVFCLFKSNRMSMCLSVCMFVPKDLANL